MTDTFTTEAPPKKASVNPVYATPKTGVTYSVYPQYEEPKKVCGNCKWFEVRFNDGSGYCVNPRIEDYIKEGLPQSLSPDFGCLPLWEAKESEGE